MFLLKSIFSNSLQEAYEKKIKKTDNSINNGRKNATKRASLVKSSGSVALSTSGAHVDYDDKKEMLNKARKTLSFFN